MNRCEFDSMIGRLDRLLSEFMRAAEPQLSQPLDLADHQTLKHHADDLIGVGRAVLAKLGEASQEAQEASPPQRNDARRRILKARETLDAAKHVPGDDCGRALSYLIDAVDEIERRNTPDRLAVKP